MQPPHRFLFTIKFNFENNSPLQAKSQRQELRVTSLVTPSVRRAHFALH